MVHLQEGIIVVTRHEDKKRLLLRAGLLIKKIQMLP